MVMSIGRVLFALFIFFSMNLSLEIIGACFLKSIRDQLSTRVWNQTWGAIGMAMVVYWVNFK